MTFLSWLELVIHQVKRLSLQKINALRSASGTLLYQESSTVLLVFAHWVRVKMLDSTLMQQYEYA